MKRKYIILYVVIVLMLSLEIGLRFFLGFCDAPLSQASNRYEYIFQPNQRRVRFGNTIFYNEYSMRSPKLKKLAKKVLGLGDSVINGGSTVDQDSLATTILTKVLSKNLRCELQVLNISAGSWGPDNVNAYLDEKGLFGASAMFLVVSSHDAYDIMEFRDDVIGSPNFPVKQYNLAIYELIDRYLPRYLPKSFSSKRENATGENTSVNSNTFNPGFLALLEKSKRNMIPFLIYLHATKSERNNGEYSSQGKEIIKFARDNNIKIVMDLESNFTDADYRDNIHLNSSGQSKMASLIEPYLVTIFTNNDEV